MGRLWIGWPAFTLTSSPLLTSPFWISSLYDNYIGDDGAMALAEVLVGQGRRSYGQGRLKIIGLNEVDAAIRKLRLIREEGEEPLQRRNMFLLGPAEAGKTTLSRSIQSTEGIEDRTRGAEVHHVTLGLCTWAIWDFAGQQVRLSAM